MVWWEKGNWMKVQVIISLIYLKSIVVIYNSVVWRLEVYVTDNGRDDERKSQISKLKTKNRQKLEYQAKFSKKIKCSR